MGVIYYLIKNLSITLFNIKYLTELFSILKISSHIAFI